LGRHKLGLIHASRASIEPVAEFYLRRAPEWRPVNLLDEGVMGDLRTREWPRAVRRLRDMIGDAVSLYGIETALVTCSALGPAEMAAIREGFEIRVIKIDEPMLERAALESAGRVGLVATFASTVETSTAWLRHFRPEIGIEVGCDTGALEALLAGDREEHDRRLVATAEEVAARGVDVLVLAQVSMARLAGEISQRTGVKLLESLTTSLAAVAG